MPPGQSAIIDNKRHQVIDFSKAEFKKYQATRDGAVIRVLGTREGVIEFPISALQYWVPWEE